MQSNSLGMKTWGVLIGRVFLGLVFLVPGIKFFMSPSIPQSIIEKCGFPLGGLLAWIVIVLLVLGGAMLMVGYRVSAASWALIAFLILATWFVHVAEKDLNGTLSNVAVIGGLMYVIAYGPGDGWKLGKR